MEEAQENIVCFQISKFPPSFSFFATLPSYGRRLILRIYVPHLGHQVDRWRDGGNDWNGIYQYR